MHTHAPEFLESHSLNSKILKIRTRCEYLTPFFLSDCNSSPAIDSLHLPLPPRALSLERRLPRVLCPEGHHMSMVSLCIVLT